MSKQSAQLEAFLFSEGGAVSKKRLLQLTGLSPDDLEGALLDLETQLQGRGLALIRTDTEAALVMTHDAGEAVIKAQGKELDREIGDAGLEVLAIVLYRGPSTRAQIDFIRGVNTSTTVRNLLARGLIERTGNPADGREYLYRPTVELLAHLGVTTAQSLPEYASISSELAKFEQQHKTQHAESTDTMHDGESLR